MDLSKLSNGAKVVLISGIVMVVNLFLPWFGVSTAFGSVTGNAFDFGMAWLGSLLVIAGAVVLAIKALGAAAPQIGSLKAEHIGLLLAALGTLFVLLQLIIGHESLGFSLDRKFGVFLGAVAAIGTGAGAFLMMKEAGLGMPTVDDFKSIGGSGGDAPPPPPGGEGPPPPPPPG